MKPFRVSRPVYMTVMLPACLTGGLIIGGLLGGWLRDMTVDPSMFGLEHTYDYYWSAYIIGGAISGAVTGGILFVVALRRKM